MNCWCYVVNEKYILPALVSAKQLRSQIKDFKEDIFIIYIGNKSDRTSILANVASLYNVQLTVVPQSILEGMPMYCARLFLEKCIDSSIYDTITYLDADTQIVGDVMNLIKTDPIRGSVLATPDIMSLMIYDKSKDANNIARYFDSIGIPHKNQVLYINSGLLKFRSMDWADISKDCLKYLNKNKHKNLKFPDQDALNFVLDGSQRLISFKWNFPAFFIGRDLDQIVQPSIIHFMSRPRPWEGPFPPWGQTSYAPYSRFVDKHPELRSSFHPAKKIDTARYMLQQTYKFYTEPWGSKVYRDRIADFEGRALI